MSNTRNPERWLNGIIGPDTILIDGERVTVARKSLNFVGAVQEDDPDDDATNISIPGTGVVPGGPPGAVQVRGGDALEGIAPGPDGEVLTVVDGQWASAPGGATPGGSTGQYQRNNGSGGLAADNALYYDSDDGIAVAGFGLGIGIGANRSVVGSAATAARTVVLPDASGQVVLTSAPQTLEDKEIDANSNTITNLTDANIKSDAAISGSKIAPNFGSQNIQTTGYVQAGHVRPTGTVASQGLIRGANNTVLAAVRKADNSADFVVLACNNLNELLVGSSATFDQQAALIRLYAANGVVMGVGSQNLLTIDASNIGILSSTFRSTAEIRGYGTFSAPFRFAKAAITQNSTADTTLTASQYECPVLEVSGTPGGAFNIIAPNTTNARFEVTNKTPSALTIRRTGGTGVTIAAGKSAIVRHDGSDYIRITPDA